MEMHIGGFVKKTNATETQRRCHGNLRQVTPVVSYTANRLLNFFPVC